jgi:head-tail adaptor
MADVADLGPLDKRVRFERRTRVPGVLSAGKGGWEKIATVWGTVQDRLPSSGERIDNRLDLGSRPARVRVRYRTDLEDAERIIVGASEQPDGSFTGGRIFNLKAGPAEIGRKVGLEFAADQESTSGNPA